MQVGSIFLQEIVHIFIGILSWSSVLEKKKLISSPAFISVPLWYPRLSVLKLAGCYFLCWNAEIEQRTPTNFVEMKNDVRRKDGVREIQIDTEIGISIVQHILKKIGHRPVTSSFRSCAAVDRSISASLDDARDAMMNACQDMMNAYASQTPASQRGGALLAPSTLRLIPLYTLSMLKSVSWWPFDDHVYEDSSLFLCVGYFFILFCFLLLYCCCLCLFLFLSFLFALQTKDRNISQVSPS